MCRIIIPLYICNYICNIPEYYSNDKGDNGDHIKEIDSVASVGGAQTVVVQSHC
jgi:hypothetical protein